MNEPTLKQTDFYDITGSTMEENVYLTQALNEEVELIEPNEAEKTETKDFEDIKETVDDELFENILTEMLDTYRAKNHDYGNSFSDLFKEFGMTSVVIRLSDKLNRLKTLCKTQAQVKDEKIEDTLLDLANYSILALMELRKKE